VGTAAAETIQRVTRGQLTRRATELPANNRHPRLEQFAAFPHSFSYASFEGGAWRGEAAFEAATLSVQYDAGAKGSFSGGAQQPTPFAATPRIPVQADR